jgi:hypothetical protein
LRAVEPEVVEADEALKAWIQRAVRFVGKLARRLIPPN